MNLLIEGRLDGENPNYRYFACQILLDVYLKVLRVLYFPLGPACDSGDIFILSLYLVSGVDFLLRSRGGLGLGCEVGIFILGTPDFVINWFEFLLVQCWLLDLWIFAWCLLLLFKYLSSSQFIFNFYWWGWKFLLCLDFYLSRLDRAKFMLSISNI